VLAAQARTHSVTELWLAASGGWIDAIAIAFAYPGLSWLGWIFTTIACYGTWGLADRYAERATELDTSLDARPELLEFLKRLCVLGGTMSALVAAYSFMTAAFHNWIS
jgi:hypothetical protein